MSMDRGEAADTPYDVVIVGGRPAGAGLAARLGARRVRVLVVDKADFPSPPAVTAPGTVHPATMRLLDEIGVAEHLYGHATGKIASLVIEYHAHFTAIMAIPEMWGRSYFYGVDREVLDHALWRNLERYPTVTARERFTMTDLVRDAGGRVVGVEGREGDGPRETLRARCVIGADGRHSQVARKAGAKVTEDASDQVSTVYSAEWEGLAEIQPGMGQSVHICATGRGTNVLLFPMPEGRTAIITHMRADRVNIGGDAEAFYLGVLDRYPGVKRRIRGARRVTPVTGIKRVANRYLEAGGPGWALVGDALHHKDPVDGQGIYDALVAAKILDAALAPFLAGERSFEDALEAYRREVLAETRPMFLATVERLRQELYEEPPEIVIDTLVRWTLNDPEYQRRFFLFLGRVVPAAGWLPRGLVLRAALRGALGDVKQRLRRAAAAPSA